MTIRAAVVALVFACNLAACTAIETDPRTETASAAEEAPPAAIERLIAPTPEMREAALSGDPVRMKQAVALLSSCQAPSSCPSEFGACTNWSPNNECDGVCVFSTICRCANPPPVVGTPGTPAGARDTNLRECGPDDNEFRRRVTFDSFRVCFNPQQQACTEWRQTFSLGGCNCFD